MDAFITEVEMAKERGWREILNNRLVKSLERCSEALETREEREHRAPICPEGD